MVAMQATWSQTVAEAVVFSKDLASLRQRHRRPRATATRQACRTGRNTGCSSFPPDPAHLDPVPATQPHRRAGGLVLVSRGGHHQPGHRQAGDVHGDDTLGASLV